MSAPWETDVVAGRAARSPAVKRYGLASSPMPMNSAPSSTRMPPMARRIGVPSTVKSLEPTNEYGHPDTTLDWDRRRWVAQACRHRRDRIRTLDCGCAWSCAGPEQKRAATWSWRRWRRLPRLDPPGTSARNAGRDLRRGLVAFHVAAVTWLSPAAACTSTTSGPRPTLRVAPGGPSSSRATDPPRARCSDDGLVHGASMPRSSTGRPSCSPPHRTPAAPVRNDAAGQADHRPPLGPGLAVAWVLFAASVVPTYAWFRQASRCCFPSGSPATRSPSCSTTSAAVGGSRWRGGGPARAGPDLLGAGAGGSGHRRRAAPRRRSRGTARRAVAARRGACSHRSSSSTCCSSLVYSSGDYDRREGSRPSVLDAVMKIGRWAFVDLFPSYLGGPVVWRPGNGRTRSRPARRGRSWQPRRMVLLAFVMAARTPGSLRTVAPVALACAAYAVPVLAMVYVGRLAQVDDITAADDLRLLPDVSAAVAVALAALVGTVLERRPARHDDGGRASTGGHSPPWPVPQRCSAASRG